MCVTRATLPTCLWPQIAYADLVLLNKLDLVEEEAITRAEADIR
jgi:G3E family GTPase